MDSNGRQRASLPGSSTFRRLPTLTRSPFRRTDKGSSPSPEPVAEANAASTSASRGSTFPSLARVVVDDSSLSSALFGTPIPPIAEDPNSASGSAPPLPANSTPNPRASAALGGVGSTSDLAGIAATPPPISGSQSLYGSSSPLVAYPYKPATTNRTPLPHSSPLATVNVNTAAGASPANYDLEPITYPAHLAQRRPPGSGSSPPPHGAAAAASRSQTSGSSPPPNINSISPLPATTPVPSASAPATSPVAPAVPARSAHRYRDFTLGSSGLVSAMNLTTQNLSAHQAIQNGVSSAPSLRTLAAVGESQQARRTSARQTSNPSQEDKSAKAREAAAAAAANAAANAATSNGHSLEPLLPSGKVPRAPPSEMYFAPIPAHGRPPAQPIRAHTGTLVDDKIWVIGGVDSKSCWRGVACFDTESYHWTMIETFGDALPPLRAHTTNIVGNTLYLFGGGDGPTYSNDVWAFDTISHRFSRPEITTPRDKHPPPRRAHTALLYRNFIVVFGGGNGQAALNDLWALDVSDPEHLSWHEWTTHGDIPPKKGYHSANLVQDKMVVFGGSDGHASFGDVHVLDLQSLEWTHIDVSPQQNRLSHTTSLVGNFLYIIGGHNGHAYAQDVLVLDLLNWHYEYKSPKGLPPPGRGYHVAVLHDSRIWISGGYNGVEVYDDVWVLELGAGSYLTQVADFQLDEKKVPHKDKDGKPVFIAAPGHVRNGNRI
ncbi:hypothetical protein Q8F55_006590 [Vanrija albida]|uniref:Uncharacterized protein n=1 Tax=Vanrija albida TaxID=181172 RepID=A0ABR3PXJ6_9TREE